MKDAKLIMVMVAAAGMTAFTFFYMKDKPTLADRIQVGVDHCLDTVGFWPCTAHHIDVVKKKVCTDDED